MNTVAVERSEKQVGIRRIANGSIEIEDPGELTAGSDPIVDLAPDACLCVVPPGVGPRGGHIVARDDGGGEHLDAAALQALGELLKTVLDLCGRRSAADVVGAHEEDDVADTVVGQYITLQSFEPRCAVRRRLQ